MWWTFCEEGIDVGGSNSEGRCCRMGGQEEAYIDILEMNVLFERMIVSMTPRRARPCLR